MQARPGRLIDTEALYPDCRDALLPVLPTTDATTRSILSVRCTPLYRGAARVGICLTPLLWSSGRQLQHEAGGMGRTATHVPFLAALRRPGHLRGDVHSTTTRRVQEPTLARGRGLGAETEEMQPSGHRADVRADVRSTVDEAGGVANPAVEPGGAGGVEPRS